MPFGSKAQICYSMLHKCNGLKPSCSLADVNNSLLQKYRMLLTFNETCFHHNSQWTKPFNHRPENWCSLYSLCFNDLLYGFQLWPYSYWSLAGVTVSLTQRHAISCPRQIKVEHYQVLYNI